MINWRGHILEQRGALRLDRSTDAALRRIAEAYPEDHPRREGAIEFFNWRDAVALGMAARQILSERAAK